MYYAEIILHRTRLKHCFELENLLELETKHLPIQHRAISSTSTGMYMRICQESFQLTRYRYDRIHMDPDQMLEGFEASPKPIRKPAAQKTNDVVKLHHLVINEEKKHEMKQKRSLSANGQSIARWPFAYDADEKIVDATNAKPKQPYFFHMKQTKIRLCVKQGSKKVAHFAVVPEDEHKLPSGMTPWHWWWQMVAQPVYREISMKDNRLDVKTHDGVLEIQHSAIDADDVCRRNKVYSEGGKVTWLLDARSDKRLAVTDLPDYDSPFYDHGCIVRPKFKSQAVLKELLRHEEHFFAYSGRRELHSKFPFQVYLDVGFEKHVLHVLGQSGNDDLKVRQVSIKDFVTAVYGTSAVSGVEIGQLMELRSQFLQVRPSDFDSMKCCTVCEEVFIPLKPHYLTCSYKCFQKRR